MFLSYKPGTSVLAIDLTGKYVKFVQGSYKGNKLSVKNVCTVDMDETIFYDGVIKDRKAFVAMISGVMKQNRMEAKEAVVTMDCSQLIRRELDVEIIPGANVKDLVTFELSRLLPINIDDYIISFRLLSAYQTEEGKSMNKVIVYAIPSVISKDLFMALKEVGLTPKAFDFNDNSLQKFISFIGTNFVSENSQAYIELQQGFVSIYIFADGILKLNRILYSDFKTDEEIVRSARTTLADEADLVVDLLKREDWNDILELNMELAKNLDPKLLKIPEGIQNQAIREFGLSPTQARFIEEIVSAKNSIIEELEKVFRFYNSRSGGKPIEKVLLYGKHAYDKEVANRISFLLGLPVEAIRFRRSDRLSLAHGTDVVLTYINAMGVMIRDYGRR